MSGQKPRTLFDKIWDAHVVDTLPDGTALLYIDLHLTHEVTTPQAFAGLRAAGRKLRRPDATLGVIDHNIATDSSRYTGIVDPESRLQVETLERNAAAEGFLLFGLEGGNQGIVHVVGPEAGISQPGMVIVCGDSQRAVGAADRAVRGTQAGEGLRGGHLVDQVQVDVEDRLAVLFLDDVRVPDLVVQGLAGHGLHVGPQVRARLVLRRRIRGAVAAI